MFKGILSIIVAFLFIKYREKIVEMTGKFGWCEKYLGMGGTYRLMVILGVLFFLWGIAKITGTEDVLFGPLSKVFNPGGTGGGADEWVF